MVRRRARKEATRGVIRRATTAMHLAKAKCRDPADSARNYTWTETVPPRVEKVQVLGKLVVILV